jgi:hypothetical protein
LQISKVADVAARNADNGEAGHHSSLSAAVITKAINYGILSDAIQAVSNGRNVAPASPGRLADRSPTIKNPLTTEEIQVLRQQLEELRLEHRDLDDVIHHLIHSAYPDQLQLKRLKKRKLKLKDTVEMIESRLIPDIDA